MPYFKKNSNHQLILPQSHYVIAILQLEIVKYLLKYEKNQYIYVKYWILQVHDELKKRNLKSNLHSSLAIILFVGACK